MKPDIIKEMGLSPMWVRKSLVPATVAAEAPPPRPAAASTSTAAAPAPAAPPPPIDAPVEKMTLQQLRITVEGCTKCALHERRGKTVFGYGDTQARVMFIGEGPGADEDRIGEPFVGKAGKLLDLMLHSIHLSRDREVYIANVVKCRPPNNRDPSAEEAQECMHYLRRQIALVQPEVLVVLGRVAAQQLLNTQTSIAQLRQKIHDYEKTPLVVTYHPAYLLRQPQEKQKAWEDLLFLRRLLATD